jgi:hypothetical protein
VDFKKENLRTLNPKPYPQIGMSRASEHTHLQRIVNLISCCWLAMSEQQQTQKNICNLRITQMTTKEDSFLDNTQSPKTQKHCEKQQPLNDNKKIAKEIC